ncbi:hypothetical protein BofuT4_uP042880.1 [Botrytis cinerea T4]|uniref:Uncharacterized protein n=1 Tax=Botryotinia fuckeliana (strain T4) TaxID=999810 RepID=G2Y1Y7_BOTF4|nr:hypothetical protein BofuT4_uP042880.1 [Botrytis cinerea T4]
MAAGELTGGVEMKCESHFDCLATTQSLSSMGAHACFCTRSGPRTQSDWK